MPKSTKAKKVGDQRQQKAWLRKVEPSGYKQRITIKKTILIVCEGQTEELYFKSFPVLTTFKVETYNTEGQSKVKLVESTSHIKKNFDIDFDEIWCVFDMDVRHEAKEFADFDNAIHKALKLGYHVAYSNDAFELWYFLHYGITESQHHRKYYFSELSKRFGFNYEKEGKKYDICLKNYKRLEDDNDASQEKAIRAARKLYETQKHLPFHQQNPVTKVFELVEELNRNLRS